ncbi:DNA helicase [Nocardia camponoti]|uniref:DNA helicase n=2 Tax=Nocardia camponoti TaxID=1616106 RepID=A0A917QNN7_9NOCA|nr:DNA helicase [Nocardia camponoti]
MGCIVSGSEHAVRVVRFWQAVELFSPRLVPDADGGLVIDLVGDEPAPWEDLSCLPALLPGRVWQFVVYGGLFEIGRAREALVRAFGEDELEADARRAGTTAAFAITVNDEGAVVAGSATLSGLVWAINRVRSASEDSLDFAGFGHDAAAFTAAFDTLTHADAPVEETVRPPRWQDVAGRGVGASLLAAGVEGGISPGLAGMAATAFTRRVLTDESGGELLPRLTGRDVQEFAGDLCSALGVRSELRAAGVRVECMQVVARDAGSAACVDRLNGGLGDDLVGVATAVERGDIGDGLRDYLAATDVLPIADRIDVRARRDVMVEGLLPGLMPAGRWPAEPLVASQQFGVNRAMAELATDSGFFAVHGAPGTGTTTMLRDLLAGIVVERAGRLAAFSDPRAAFVAVTEQVPVAKNYPVAAHRLAQTITGFEVVLATGSDDAAEDVVTELQHIDAVGTQVRVDHFTRLAASVGGEPAWGLIAAALGDDRRSFGERFWFGDRFRAERRSGHTGGMLDLLKQAEAEPELVPDWAAAVRDFATRQADVTRLAQERQDVADAVASLPEITARLDDYTDEIANADAAHSHWRERNHLANEHLRAAQAAHHRVGKALAEHTEQRPKFTASLTSGFQVGMRWSARSNELLRQRHAAEAEMRRRQTEVDHTRQEWADAAETGRRLIAEHRELLIERERQLEVIERARESWAATIPFGDVSAEETAFQLCKPWADEEYSTARRDLFLSALRLHRAFVLNTAPFIRDNLIVAIALMRGDLALPKPETVAAAWQTLFLTVPLVATTFTALPRLFAGLGRESLGWLFVDDAGQAAPQSVAGALWRSRRAVIVGDHRQLGPVGVLPTSAQLALVRQFGLGGEWMPDRASVRHIADRSARFGTWLRPAEGTGPIWVGVPLRVHRRSDLPIFELTHGLAYDDDLLVFGTPERPEFPDRDRWIDVRSARAEGNWIPGEGEALAALLTDLTEEMGIDASQIRVMSPFRDVAAGAQAVAHEVLGAQFANHQVGTVHAMQTSAAEVVVLVLGTSPAAGGARRWAAATPNVLNAAISRARRRVYVIGNYRLWSSQRYFEALAAHWTVESEQLVR